MKDGAVLAWGETIGQGEEFFPQVPEPSWDGIRVSAIACGSRHNIVIIDSPDCNLNGLPDKDDIAAGTTRDDNNNGVPDICDIAAANALLAAANARVTTLTSENATLTSENAALTAQLNCGDLNGDGEVNSADIGLMLVSYGPCAR